MGANRLPELSASALWAAAPDASVLAHAHPPAKLALFRAPNFSAPHISALPAPAARISLANHSSSDPPSVLVATAAGDLFLSNKLLARLTAAPSVVVHDRHHVVAATAQNLTVISLSDAQQSLSNSDNLHHKPHGHAAPLSAALLLRPAQLVLASQQITVHDLPNARLQTRFTGHASPVTCMATLSTHSFVSAAKHERMIMLWRVPSQPLSHRKRRRLTAVSPSMALALPRATADVLALCADLNSDGRNVAAVLNSSEVVVWKDLPHSALGAVQSSFVVRAVDDVPVVHALFVDENRLVVLYGRQLCPDSFTVHLNSVESDVVLLPRVSVDVITASTDVKPHAKVQLVQQAVALQSSNVAIAPPPSAKRKEPADDSEHDGDSADEKDDAYGEQDATIQDKLAALGVTTDTTRADMPTVLPSLDSSRLDSRVVILCQAVRVGDDHLFDNIIDSTQNADTIRNTVDEMPPEVATGALLDMLVDRLERYPSRVEKLLTWIRTVLIEHAGTLISQQHNQTLHALQAIIEARTQNLEALSRLEGRLELVVGQGERQKRLKQVNLSQPAAGLEYTFGEGVEKGMRLRRKMAVVRRVVMNRVGRRMIRRRKANLRRKKKGVGRECWEWDCWEGRFENEWNSAWE
ncbi:WD repeat-containing protein 43 [Gracilariopsis chorda]|uniref:WD repeat-containing protein 43 n=1 Tax=Gracilariopsis chorda TaxID=448386 RepID=A0A2V3INW5_9FLOR|nr:WD repeat-containing protein 43 [Gracilariopsis chorda]|eukprot:PXF42820.1 WD repeat-containing protein 43 [Gracilariopsis chorda]